MESGKSDPNSPRASAKGENSKAVILAQLKQIQDSHSFGSSARSKEFLSYVVEHGLEGREELLKERSIGVNIFNRNPDYITGDDPIVRVKAAEVRRRLAQYYAEAEKAPDVRIEIPVGSYVPKFHWRQGDSPAPVAQEADQPTHEVEGRSEFIKPTHARRWRIWGLAITFAALGIAATIVIRSHDHHAVTIDQFWEPLLTTKQPVLICVPAPVSYALNSELYQQSPLAASGIYGSIAKRNATPLQLDPNASIKWKQITPLADFYVNKDDAYAAEEISTLFAKENRPMQLRLGSDYTYEDLRSSPAILVGAYNNPWMDRVMSDLPIGFQESDGILWIEDRAKVGQAWRASTDGRLGNKDFALIARLLHAKTGQFLVIVSGVGMVGTKAAGNLISHEQDLEIALRGAPEDWRKKNMEVVVETDIVDGSPSPPKAVAVRVW